MPETPGLVLRLVARVRALLTPDWLGRAGKDFRTKTNDLAKCVVDQLGPISESVDAGIDLGVRKLEGLASAEHAAAMKAYAEEENCKIETELQRRTIDYKIRQQGATADRLEAEATEARIKSMDAELEFFLKLQKMGIVFTVAENGDFKFERASKDFDWKAVKRELSIPTFPIASGKSESPEVPDTTPAPSDSNNDKTEL